MSAHVWGEAGPCCLLLGALAAFLLPPLCKAALREGSDKESTSCVTCVPGSRCS